ncbi:hypothetical protein [Flavobacterium sp. H122]|uniref:hypothetical protein n=1 Tax=Flavobacterium sp. H122 TaxID=2529860 RepID=UPI0010A9F5FE|nr:hypothetical protein [Flavobacterium sp. H122]
MEIDFKVLKVTVQAVIDCLAKKDSEGAGLKLEEAKELLEELTDFAVDDNDLIELSRYKVLLNQLEQKTKL